MLLAAVGTRMSGPFTESIVEDAALEWLAALGCAVLHGPEVAPGELYAERSDYGEVVLAQRLREAPPPRLVRGELQALGAERSVRSALV